jgi:hypothetical protein
MAWHRLTLSKIIASILVLFILVTLFEDGEYTYDDLRDASRQHRQLLPNSLGDYSDPRSASLRGGRKALEAEVISTAAAATTTATKTSTITTKEPTPTIEELLSEVDHELQALLEASSDTPKQADVNIDEPFSKIKVSYVTNLPAEPKGSAFRLHRREIEAALLANIHNPHFDQFVVFLDGVSDESNCVHFIKGVKELYRRLSYSKLTCIGIPDAQPTYYQMFKNTLNEAVTGDVVVLAKPDQVFDDTVSLARTLHAETLAVLDTRGFSNKMPAITKYFYETIVGKEFLMNSKQQVPGEWVPDRCSVTTTSTVDAWIFHKRKIKYLKEEDFQRSTNNETMPFHMSEMGAESAALWAMQRSYPFTYNACDRVHSWHFHLTPEP